MKTANKTKLQTNKEVKADSKTNNTTPSPCGEGWGGVFPLLLFVLYAAYILIGENSDMLYTVQDRTEFFATTDFFRQQMAQPFGLMAYLGSFLSQFFYYPALGASLLLLLWIAIYFVSFKAFPPPVRGDRGWLRALCLLPLACLLISTVDLGYWVYIMPFRGYWFAHSLAYLCLLLLLWAVRCTPAKHRCLWYAATLLTFPLLGIYALFFALCLLLMQCVDILQKRTQWWQPLVGILVAVFTPLLWARLCYTEMSLLQVQKSGLPYFVSTTVSALRPSYPFVALAVITLLLSIFSAAPLCPPERGDGSGQESRHGKPSTKQFKLPLVRGDRGGLLCLVVVFAIIVLGVHFLSFRDYNYQAEMRMNRLAMDDDWQTIIHEAEQAEHPSRTMVLLKNIALMNTGELGNRSFQLDNDGLDINNIDSLNLNTMQIAAPMIYFQYGKPQYATRWCMENAVGYGFSPYYLKMFARAAQETGEHKVKDRYLHLLSLTAFHKDWRPLPPTQLVRDLHEAFSDVIDSDDNNCERYLIQIFGMSKGSQYRLVHELNLFYSMLYRDPQFFWPAFYTYALPTKGANLPIHYQEAYLIMNENYPVNLPFKVQISPAVQQNYSLYKQAVESQVRRGIPEREAGTALRPAWKHTFWWFIMYGRKVY